MKIPIKLEVKGVEEYVAKLEKVVRLAEEANSLMEELTSMEFTVESSENIEQLNYDPLTIIKETMRECSKEPIDRSESTHDIDVEEP